MWNNRGPFGLPTEMPQIKRSFVLTYVSSRFDRLIGTLCVALMLFYAATAPAKAADQIQHSPVFMISHQHGELADFAVDTVHDSPAEHADHHDNAPADDESTPGDHLAGGHHHHGDTGPNLLVPNAVTASGIAPIGSLHGIGNDRQIAGRRSIGPERPPRPHSLTV